VIGGTDPSAPGRLGERRVVTRQPGHGAFDSREDLGDLELTVHGARQQRFGDALDDQGAVGCVGGVKLVERRSVWDSPALILIG
jgi:hypothetical protein